MVHGRYPSNHMHTSLAHDASATMPTDVILERRETTTKSNKILQILHIILTHMLILL